ncbi:paraquat-inducible protein A [Thiolapillus brandeum]|uniref:Paraquat-inducible protein A n=1 Tax=Thiolapillus brandeum TaxID=1076588 RepID=A0A7U6JII6_9GAMM|nr:paraquat-inducible protein A [Thiolapillus brandeum]BAO44843.1 paraquat-inducible protein A [Thiolapillus brandeum]
MEEKRLMACRECDALQYVPRIEPGRRVLCRECGSFLYRQPRGGIERPLALMLGALLLYLLANLFPLVTLNIGGSIRETSLTGSGWALYQHDMKLLGMLVLATTVAVPGAIIGGTLYVLTGLYWNIRLPGLRGTLSLLSHMHPWEMADVFVISVLVALVKMSGMAEVIVDGGLYALLGAIVLGIAARAGMDIYLLWNMLERIPVNRDTATGHMQAGS